MSGVNRNAPSGHDVEELTERAVRCLMEVHQWTEEYARAALARAREKPKDSWGQFLERVQAERQEIDLTADEWLARVG